ncbi:histidine kinase [Methylomonas sp. SURF-1]|uniref:Histidine kinase n=1 Tax=Methylomonas aurea TaxID=2952224 RepID=A0ABT1UN40_9GAMM|nr:histidine kinase [Methylomonas sp. SURF-1]MCQ8183654.1 histidine kinase [Methylomonas sp. SURF-1]
MALHWHLLIRIVLAGGLSLLATLAYALYQSHSLAERNAAEVADGVARQLESQLLLIEAGLGRGGSFPDFELWKQAGGQAGSCLAYLPETGGTPRSLCYGGKPTARNWPSGFETAYRSLFQPGLPVSRSIRRQDAQFGVLTFAASAETEIAAAWQNVRDLATLSAVTLAAVCALVYWSVRRALRPAQTIVRGLTTLAAGDLAHRLPGFQLDEWRRIGIAVNALAESQQQLLQQRRKLAAKLIQLQEDERRYLARELHDEFGQCLAGINAVASSVRFGAAEQAPELAAEAEQINEIAGGMLLQLRGLLQRLRPAELEQLGLAASLHSAVADWNRRDAGKTQYRLHVAGDCRRLTDRQALALFRIAQECQTNIAKHAAAANVTLALQIDERRALLQVEDDGVARELPFAGGGLGLLGMRERVAALNGELSLAIVEPHGLRVAVSLPLAPEPEAQ